MVCHANTPAKIGSVGASRQRWGISSTPGELTAMNVLYDLLGNVFTAIEPRNERARVWLDKLIVRAYGASKVEQNPVARAATVAGLKNEFELMRITQGRDERQRDLYEQVEHLLKQLEASTTERVG